MTDESPGGDIAAQDELLELLYWLEGEGFEGSATIEGIVRFVAKPETSVRSTLTRLITLGSVRRDDASNEYRLTDGGRVQAARRFAEEFAPLLAQGHGECSDPDCDCHDSPEGAADCRTHRTHEHNH